MSPHFHFLVSGWKEKKAAQVFSVLFTGENLLSFPRLQNLGHTSLRPPHSRHFGVGTGPGKQKEKGRDICVFLPPLPSFFIEQLLFSPLLFPLPGWGFKDTNTHPSLRIKQSPGQFRRRRKKKKNAYLGIFPFLLLSSSFFFLPSSLGRSPTLGS